MLQKNNEKNRLLGGSSSLGGAGVQSIAESRPKAWLWGRFVPVFKCFF
jgi:hypothetical protein